VNLEMKGVHFDLDDDTREFIRAKLEKIDFARDYIVDLRITMTKEKSDFVLEATIHFRWGSNSHISLREFELHPGLEKLVDKIDQKVRKEKDKITEHKEH